MTTRISWIYTDENGPWKSVQSVSKVFVVAMKTKKKKVAFPRRTWQINPVMCVKDSAKKYSRPRARQEFDRGLHR